MQKILNDFSVPAVFAGFITFLVGISVSAVLVIQAAQILGASGFVAQRFEMQSAPNWAKFKA